MIWLAGFFLPLALSLFVDGVWVRSFLFSCFALGMALRAIRRRHPANEA